MFIMTICVVLFIYGCIIKFVCHSNGRALWHCAGGCCGGAGSAAGAVQLRVLSVLVLDACADHRAVTGQTQQRRRPTSGRRRRALQPLTGKYCQQLTFYQSSGIIYILIVRLLTLPT